MDAWVIGVIAACLIAVAVVVFWLWYQPEEGEAAPSSCRRRGRRVPAARPTNQSSYNRRGTPFFFKRSGMEPTASADLNVPGADAYAELADEGFREELDMLTGGKRFKDNQLPRDPLPGTESMVRYVGNYSEVPRDPILDNPLIKKTEVSNHGTSIWD